jgi:hypothetical protein
MKALHVLFLLLPGSGWITSSPSLLLLLPPPKGEFTSYVSLAESPLKLPPYEFESFTVSFILSFQINILC